MKKNNTQYYQSLSGIFCGTFSQQMFPRLLIPDRLDQSIQFNALFCNSITKVYSLDHKIHQPKSYVNYEYTNTEGNHNYINPNGH